MATFEYCAVRGERGEDRFFVGGMVAARSLDEAANKLRVNGLEPKSLRRAGLLVSLTCWLDRDVR